ncbi:MAG: hypothetical protein OHK93_007424 [Ramalina farinacea]|uniref:BTB domain-containing protein n=1 Tax=Ramalina farinacea TaxID=258253 RepID=A0AA43QPP4_9LECA|nr:hypothetical protein [Ramalina farinacea]
MVDSVRHFSYVNEGTVSLVVGEKKTKFHIHAHKLSEVSTFFRAALESGFREAGERMITLSEDVETVDCFVQWVYHQKIRVSENRNCDLYIFADKYDIPDLKRYALTKLFRIIWKCRPPAPFKVENWYQHTSATSGLRLLIRDWYFWKASSEYLASKQFHDALIQNPEFAADLVAVLGRFNLNRMCPKPENMEIEQYV